MVENLKKKRIIILDVSEDPIIIQAFNDIIHLPYYKMEYKEKNNRNIWQQISSKISNHPKCRQLIREDFIEPPVTSRHQGFGMIVKKPNVEVTKMPFTNSKIKFIFNHKIF